MRLKPFAIAIFGCSALSANAAIEQIYNYGGLEFVRSGNAHHVHPATPESTRIRGGWVLEISDIEPKATAKTDLPYSNRGGALAKVTVTPSIDPKKVAAKATDALKGAVMGAATGNGYVAAAALACGLVDCASAAAALIDWGVDKFKKNDDGSISAVVPDPNADVSFSDGSTYSLDGVSGLSLSSACGALIAYYNGRITDGWYYTSRGVDGPGNTCLVYQHRPNGVIVQETGWQMQKTGGSSCLIGSTVVNGVCNGTAPTQEVPLQSYIDSRYTGKGWDNHWAKMTAAIVAEGGNVFTDGTSVDITGPATVPLTSSETKTGVQLLPGTTTPAPATHTGPTESGTQTTTTTTSAKNKFNPAPFTSTGSGSSGGPATGPSMTTTQTTTTTTSVTNNITNVTNITNETTTETEEAPEEAPTDTPFADLPELYKQKYPDGLIGVMRTQFTAMKATPLFSLPAQLMGDLPQTGQCPSWQLNLNFAAWANFGTRNIGADCSIWDFASWVVIISALILARQLVFGG